MPRWIICAVDLAGNSWQVGDTTDPYEALRLTLIREHGSERLRYSYDEDDGRMTDMEEVISDLEWDREQEALAHIIEAWVA